jgi:hypothetical protein
VKEKRIKRIIKKWIQQIGKGGGVKTAKRIGVSLEGKI